MPPRWTIRIVACLLFVGATACAGAAQPRTARPNEVQVVEPAGKPEAWSFAPAEITVARGTTVTFVNHGREFHSVTADVEGRPFDLSIDTNHTRTLTFENAGTFAYHCGVHPQMKGVIHVCEGACG